MKYNLIFYISKKTSYCERALRKALSAIDGEPHRIAAATSPTLLGEEVGRGLRTCPLTVIIGGFNSYEDDNLTTVLSRVFSNSSLTLENMRKLSSDSGGTGYIVRYKTQVLLALPDNPDDIAAMCSEELLSFIQEKTAPAEPEESTAPEESEKEPSEDEKAPEEDTSEESQSYPPENDAPVEPDDTAPAPEETAAEE